MVNPVDVSVLTVTCHTSYVAILRSMLSSTILNVPSLCLAMSGLDIALTCMACISLSLHHMNPVFSGRFYSRLLVSLCLLVQQVSAEDKSNEK